MKALLIICYCFMSFVLYAQKVPNTKFRCVFRAVILKDRDEKFVTIDTAEDCNYLISFTNGGSALQIYKTYSTEKVDIIAPVEHYTDKMNREWYRFSCVDSDNISCEFRLLIYSLAQQHADKVYRECLYIDYGNITYMYEANGLPN